MCGPVCSWFSTRISQCIIRFSNDMVHLVTVITRTISKISGSLYPLIEFAKERGC